MKYAVNAWHKNGSGKKWVRAQFLNYKCFILFFVLGDIKGIEGEGMPHYRNPFERGNLYIKFDVTFPESHFANEVKLKVSFLYYS